MIQELAKKIWSREEFQKEYFELISQQLKVSTGVVALNSVEFDRSKINRLLQSATALSGTEVWEYREAANRIAISVWDLFGKRYDHLQELVKFILGRMGNFPTVNLLENKTDENTRQGLKDDIPRVLPIRLSLEIAAHEQDNLVVFKEGEEILLTDFQSRLWRQLESGNSLSVSAPTSAGKSYALQRFISSRAIGRHNFLCAYIVPTRALINQVSVNLTDLVSSVNENVEIITIPLPPSQIEGKKNIIYVLTQERLHYLISDADIDFDLVIIDESQMISANENSDNSRGVMLQSVVESLLRKSIKTQVMFASPLTKNPDIFQNIFDLGKLTPIIEDESPVPQNLFFLDIDPGVKRTQVSALIQDKKIELGWKKTNLGKTALKTDFLTLSTVAWEFGQNEKNIIYTNDADKSEKVAQAICNFKGGSVSIDPEVKEFADFVKEHVHEEYRLADTLLKGVAFHYGNMPAIIRKTVEELFDEGKLDFLVCTSTLLHGVNLPAKNLFLLKPTKGKSPLSSIEFWNLAGRAGRMGRDFSGNVFMININKWVTNPLQGEKKQEIVPSYNYYVTQKKEELLEFISNEQHPSGMKGKQGIENSFVKLYNDYKGGVNKSIVDDELLEAIRQVDKKVSLPQQIIEKNINISPFRQQQMYDHMIEQINTGQVNTLIPRHPSSEWSSLHENFKDIFKKIHFYFEGINNRSHLFFAPFALKWMRGDSLSKMIDDSFEYKTNEARRKKEKLPTIHTVIREIMAEIESSLRFRYVKYTSCYIDLLVEALKNTGNEAYVERIPSIPLFLEVGASSVTMISFISLGLSRTTSSILGKHAAHQNLDREGAKEWILRSNFSQMGISMISQREIASVFAR